MSQNSLVCLLVVVVAVCFCGPVSIAFADPIDYFEDGNHDGWLLTAGGGGSDGVEFFNESNWAYVYTNKSGVRSLSKEFIFDAASVLSFDMQLAASSGYSTGYNTTTHAASGVTITFENSFNISLGSVTFIRATSSSLEPDNSYSVSDTPDSYSGTMSEWAALANVDPAAMTSISDVELKFWTQGRTQDSFHAAASARVRFDNVAVPEPASFILLSLGSLAFIRQRHG